MSATLSKYEYVQDTIYKICRSRLQVKILLSLGEGKKNLVDLREITGSSSQAIIPIIRKLEASHLVFSLRTEYTLSPMGWIVYTKIKDCVFTVDVLKKQKDFWNNHFIEAIPPVFLQEIGHLQDCNMIGDSTTDIFQAYSQFLKMVKEGENIKSVISIMSSAYAKAIVARVTDGVCVDAVVSSDVARQLRLEPYREIMNDLCIYDNFTISFVSEPVKLALLVTDSCFSLGLYKNDGKTYDISSHIRSNDKTALSWGNRVFQYYKERSAPVTT